MATIIDSLLITLGLDSGQFDAGSKKVNATLKQTGDEADKSGKKINQTAKSGAAGFKELTKAAAAFLAIIGGTAALKHFIEDTISSNAALDRLSKNLGMSVESISAWSNAAELAGGSASGMQGTLDMLSKAQTEIAVTGQSSLIPYLSSLGVSLYDTVGKARPLDDMLLDLSERFEQMDRTKANNIGRMMGIDQDTMQLLLRGRKEVELTILRQKEYGAVSRKQAEEASRLSRAITEGKQSFAAFGRELLSAATPAIEKLFAMFADFGNWIKENQEFVQAFLTIVGAGLAAIALAVTPINVTIVAVTALAAAIAGLYQDYQVWKRGGESLIDWGKWEPGITAASNGIRWIRDLLEDMVYRAIAAADVLSAVFDRDWERVKFAAKEFVAGNGKKYGERPPEVAPNATPTTSAGPQTKAEFDALYAKSMLDVMKVGTLPNVQDDARSRFIAQAAAKLNVAPSVVDAHLRSETGATGKSTIGDYNYGNIKTGSSWVGQSKVREVDEYDSSGKKYRENAAFRAYSSPEEAGNDYATFIQKRFPKAVNAGDATKYAQGLKAGGYATDPLYVEKITKIANDLERKSNLLNGIPNATQSAQGSGAAKSAELQRKGEPQASTTAIDTKIGEIKVYSAATDAQGIARDIGKEVNYLFTSDANYGLT